MNTYQLLLLIVSLSSNITLTGINTIPEDIGICSEIEVIDIHGGIIEAPIEEIIVEPETSINKFNVNGMMLREGIVSEEVFKLKQFLKTRGYMDFTEKYYFDSNTAASVRKYQNDNGLAADGIIGVTTFEKINFDLELYDIFIPEIQIEMTSGSPEGNWVIINKSSNTLFHLNGKEIISKYPVATGKSATFTPEGKFSIATKSVNPYWGGAGRFTPVKGGAPNNPLGKRWMGLSINGGGWYGIHGNSDSGSIGRYISLGCIRMRNEDVELLYELIGLKTPVWIGSEMRMKEYGVLFN